VQSGPCRPPTADVQGETDHHRLRALAARWRHGAARSRCAARQRNGRHNETAADPRRTRLANGPLHSPRQSCAAVGAAGGRLQRL
jgi:hypothetical protein